MMFVKVLKNEFNKFFKSFMLSKLKFDDLEAISMSLMVLTTC